MYDYVFIAIIIIVLLCLFWLILKGDGKNINNDNNFDITVDDKYELQKENIPINIIPPRDTKYNVYENKYNSIPQSALYNDLPWDDNINCDSEGLNIAQLDVVKNLYNKKRNIVLY